MDFIELRGSLSEVKSYGLKRAVLCCQMITSAKRLGDFRKVDRSFYKESDGFTVADVIDLGLQRVCAVVAERRLSLTAALGITVLVFFAFKVL